MRVRQECEAAGARARLDMGSAGCATTTYEFDYWNPRQVANDVTRRQMRVFAGMLLRVGFVKPRLLTHVEMRIVAKYHYDSYDPNA